ncbi:MAG: redox-sensing transcriptional repressor Rex [Chloroflexi bacterium]|nr:redox-sensing transcriptional repressor Rex [Chloroflexota bacterium]
MVRTQRASQDIPDIVVSRLPLYLQALTSLQEQGMAVIKSHELAAVVQATPAQIRKDFSYFGKFGKQGMGYSVERLLSEIRLILGLDRTWNLAIVGLGRVGRALVSYRGFLHQGFHIVAAFDQSPKVIGKKVGRLVVQDMAYLQEALKTQGVDIGVVAVPVAEAQKVVNQLVQCGIKGILNYAPTTPQVPPGVQLRTVDPVPSLQSMTFYLKEASTAKVRAKRRSRPKGRAFP